jgi:transcriptional regulator GlxA family with amidase domain
MAPRVRRMASICSGTFILAAAGLLHHRRVTTNWLFSDLLATAYPTIEVDSSLLFARDGNIYSSGGIVPKAYSSIPPILAKPWPATARCYRKAAMPVGYAVARRSENSQCVVTPAAVTDWQDALFTPRRVAVVGASASPGKAGALEAKNRPDISELQAWILGHPGEDLSIQALADRMAMSPRNFARLFRDETGDTPAQFAERARADAARCKLEQTVVPVETIAKECGFGNAERMRRTFQRLFEVSPHDYRARFRSTLLN